MKIIAIVQARITSTRLPKKVMKKINNSLIQKNLKFIEEIETLIDSKINQKSQPPP